MNLTDKELGMDRSISRRDFLNGAAAITAATAIPGNAFGGPGESAASVGYPPRRSGLRGSHPGSYEVAHQLVWQGRQDWGNVHDAEGDTTRCHACAEPLVVRDWYEIHDFSIRDGACPACGTAVAGVFDRRAGDWGRKRLRIRVDA